MTDRVVYTSGRPIPTTVNANHPAEQVKADCDAWLDGWVVSVRNELHAEIAADEPDVWLYYYQMLEDMHSTSQAMLLTAALIKLARHTQEHT